MNINEPISNPSEILPSCVYERRLQNKYADITHSKHIMLLRVRLLYLLSGIIYHPSRKSCRLSDFCE